MKRTVVYLILLVVASGFFAIPAVQAALPLVPCNGPDCRACDLVTMGDRIIKWLVLTMATVIGLIFAWGGVLMVTSAGDTHKVDQARSMMTNSIVGFLILLSAWMIINTIFKVMVPNQQLGVWNEIKCVAPLGKTADPIPQPGGGGTGGVIGATCSLCKPIPATIPTNGNACEGGGTCQINPDMATRLTALQSVMGDWRVSEAWPPTGYTESNPKGIHAEACHGTATCIDMSYNTGLGVVNGTRIRNDSAVGALKNLTMVYEVPNTARRDVLIGQGATNVIVVAGINREHYSVYMCDKDSSPRACQR